MVIYKTTNRINGKIYIGKDKYDKPNYFGSGVALKNSLKKYGKENFQKEILERCNSEEEMSDREIFWIKEMNSRNPQIGYNISSGGRGGDLLSKNANLENIRRKISENHANISGHKNPMFGKKHTDESRKNMSVNTKKAFEKNPNLSKNHSMIMKEKSKGRGNSNYNSTPVLQYDLNMEFIKEWRDLYEIRESGFNSKLVSQCCRGNYKTSQGFIWRFK